MIHPLASIALPQFLPHKTRHHAAHPLLPDDRVAGVVDGNVIVVVDAVVRRRNGGLLGLEGFGLKGWHFGAFFFGSESKLGFGFVRSGDRETH